VVPLGGSSRRGPRLFTYTWFALHTGNFPRTAVARQPNHPATIADARLPTLLIESWIKTQLQ